MALDKDLSLPAAFRKVLKIGKGLKSINGTSNNARYFKENYSRDLKKTGRIALV